MPTTSSTTKGTRKYKQIMADVGTSKGTTTGRQSGVQESESLRDLTSTSARRSSSSTFANIGCAVTFTIPIKSPIPPARGSCPC
jgi:predicted transposase YdaD